MTEKRFKAIVTDELVICGSCNRLLDTNLILTRAITEEILYEENKPTNKPNNKPKYIFNFDLDCVCCLNTNNILAYRHDDNNLDRIKIVVNEKKFLYVL